MRLLHCARACVRHVARLSVGSVACRERAPILKVLLPTTDRQQATLLAVAPWPTVAFLRPGEAAGTGAMMLSGGPPPRLQAAGCCGVSARL